MHSEDKHIAALALLATTGMRRSNYAPLWHRLLWKAGLKVPPPHFLSLTVNFLDCGVWFAVPSGFLMWFMGTSPLVAVGLAVFAGVVFGLGMACYYRYGARKHGIPLWRNFSARM